MIAVKNRVNGIQHLGIPTRDMESTLSFYQTIGFERIYETLNNGKRVCFLQLASLVIEAYEADDTAGKPGAIDHVALDVDDIEQVWQEAQARNFQLLHTEIQFLPFFENGVRFFTIVGPNQEKVEFNQKM